LIVEKDKGEKGGKSEKRVRLFLFSFLFCEAGKMGGTSEEKKRKDGKRKKKRKGPEKVKTVRFEKRLFAPKKKNAFKDFSADL
jgi:hypothetical protein